MQWFLTIEQIKLSDIVSRDQMPTDNSMYLNKWALTPTWLSPHVLVGLLLCLSDG